MLRSLFCALSAASLVLLAACGGGGKPTVPGNQATDQAGNNLPAVQLELQLLAQPEGQDWRVTLSAPNATDLYQIAGSVSYDKERYAVLRSEAGGGLGGPEQALYVSGEPEPGRLDFAYTRRMAGPGISGPVNLYSIVVRPLDSSASLSAAQVAADFRLELGASRIKARDSRKQDLDCRLRGVR